VADFDFGPAETDPQAEGLARRPHVVSALRDMPIAQRSDHLAFDDDLVLDNHGVEKTTIPRCWTRPSLDFRISWPTAFS
jgi:hypothetical protein